MFLNTLYWSTHSRQRMILTNRIYTYEYVCVMYERRGRSRLTLSEVEEEDDEGSYKYSLSLCTLIIPLTTYTLVWLNISYHLLNRVFLILPNKIVGSGENTECPKWSPSLVHCMQVHYLIPCFFVSRSSPFLVRLSLLNIITTSSSPLPWSDSSSIDDWLVGGFTSLSTYSSSSSTT